MFNRWPVYARVLVSLIDGSALEGLLTRKAGPLIVLSDATLYTREGEPARLDGDVYIERDRVLYLQVALPKLPD